MFANKNDRSMPYLVRKKIIVSKGWLNLKPSITADKSQYKTSLVRLDSTQIRLAECGTYVTMQLLILVKNHICELDLHSVIYLSVVMFETGNRNCR